MIQKAAVLYDAGQGLKAGISANMAKYAAGNSARTSRTKERPAIGGGDEVGPEPPSEPGRGPSGPVMLCLGWRGLRYLGPIG
ncbi:hypothetical protein Vqi01_33950 [Micromonospora qiuiae]|uniref:Uncharacterized protein n=1 Tax=Micromonospora qiuiae TaxID=502268 RepID=A0ABQ4JDP7_9ACTN|nr:hypothetical protein Vqi01_33950 [Micromonospora qiuiae]